MKNYSIFFFILLRGLFWGGMLVGHIPILVKSLAQLSTQPFELQTGVRFLCLFLSFVYFGFKTFGYRFIKLPKPRHSWVTYGLIILLLHTGGLCDLHNGMDSSELVNNYILPAIFLLAQSSLLSVLTHLPSCRVLMNRFSWLAYLLSRKIFTDTPTTSFLIAGSISRRGPPLPILS